MQWPPDTDYLPGYHIRGTVSRHLGVDQGEGGDDMTLEELLHVGRDGGEDGTRDPGWGSQGVSVLSRDDRLRDRRVSPPAEGVRDDVPLARNVDNLEAKQQRFHFEVEKPGVLNSLQAGPVAKDAKEGFVIKTESQVFEAENKDSALI